LRRTQTDSLAHTRQRTRPEAKSGQSPECGVRRRRTEDFVYCRRDFGIPFVFDFVSASLSGRVRVRVSTIVPLAERVIVGLCSISIFHYLYDLGLDATIACCVLAWPVPCVALASMGHGLAPCAGPGVTAVRRACRVPCDRIAAYGRPPQVLVLRSLCNGRTSPVRRLCPRFIYTSRSRVHVFLHQ
jgi:hypothetical protein